MVKFVGKTSCKWRVSRKRRPKKTKTYDLENDDLENNDLENDDLENDDLENDDLENDDLKKTAGSGGRLIEVCEMPHPRTKPK